MQYYVIYLQHWYYTKLDNAPFFYWWTLLYFVIYIGGSFNTDITNSWIASYNGTYDLWFSNKTILTMLLIFLFLGTRRKTRKTQVLYQQSTSKRYWLTSENLSYKVFPDLAKKLMNEKLPKEGDLEIIDNQVTFKYFLKLYFISKFKFVIDGSLDFTFAVLAGDYLMTIS